MRDYLESTNLYVAIIILYSIQRGESNKFDTEKSFARISTELEKVLLNVYLTEDIL